MVDCYPARVIIFRHAEKTGLPGDLELSDVGRKRACWLASYIPQAFGMPDFIFAASPSERSVRPTRTVEPLAAQAGLNICEEFGDEDVEMLRDHVTEDPKYQGKLVAVCWRHGELDHVAAVFGAPEGTYPSPWPNDLYDRIICIDFAVNGVAGARAITQPF